MTKINKQVQLEQQPEGTPNEKDFRVVETEIPSPKNGEFLAKNLFLSLDPYMRGRMNDSKSYAPSIKIGGKRFCVFVIPKINEYKIIPPEKITPA